MFIAKEQKHSMCVWFLPCLMATLRNVITSLDSSSISLITQCYATYLTGLVECCVQERLLSCSRLLSVYSHISQVLNILQHTASIIVTAVQGRRFSQPPFPVIGGVERAA